MSNVASAPAPKLISISQKVSAVNEMLNLHLTPAKVKSILASLGFTPTLILPLKKGEEGGGRIRIQVPWWRLDIKIPEDLYEEVGRIFGLNKLVPTLPKGELKPPLHNNMRELTEAARDVLLSLGYDEVYNYSFYGHDALQKDGSSLEREPHAQIENPINPSQEFLRTNLTRNLLEAASRNVRVFDRVEIFEVGKVFHLTPTSSSPSFPPEADPPLAEKGRKEGEKTVIPQEETHLAVLCTQKGASEEQVFRKLKGDVTALIGKQKKAEFRQMDGGLDIYFAQRSEAPTPMSKRESGVGGTWVGWLGPVSEARRLAWKIKDPGAVCEFNMDAVLAASFHPLKYSPISEFPPALRDLAFTVDEQTRYGEVEKVLGGVDPLVVHVELFDIYRGQAIGEGKKSLAFHIILQSLEKTLSDAEIDAAMEKIKLSLQEKLKAEIRS